MQPKNLGWKFAFVGLLIAMCVYTIWAKELRQGIDLKGGHILTFEIQSTQHQRDRVEADLANVQKQLTATTQPDAKATLEAQVKQLEQQRDQVSRGSETAQLVQDVIKRLKKRIDPNGLYMLEWKPVGRNRFEVRMPLGTEDSLRAKQEYLRMLQQLQDSNIQRSEIQRVTTLAETPGVKAEERNKAIKEIARGDEKREQKLGVMADEDIKLSQAKAAYDKAKANPATPAKDLAALQAAYEDKMASYDAAVRDVLATNINTETLGQVLELYVSAKERGNIPLAERKEREQAFDDGVKEAEKVHADRKTQIEQVVTSYENWAEKRSGLDDPADLKRLIAKSGVLEFRIGPTMPGSSHGPALSEAELESYDNQLAEQGPVAGHSRNDPYQWFEIRGTTERFSSDLIIRKYAGKKYILLSSQDGYTMLQDDPTHPWSLRARPGSDNLGRPAINFSLDTRGANLMGALTTAHTKQYMAILLDDQVYSAPIINSTIYSNGTIEGDFSAQQVTELVNTLEAGALEGRVNDTPVSEKTIAPSMGEENRAAGLRAAYVSLIAVVAFMFVYYLVAGCIANAAMIFNLLLILGAMSFVEAVFTLPGIAGLTLSMAMAVDANVLIYERLREEQRKTQSLRMAIRNAYAEAFSAIFDSNITTLIAAVILLWIGTEEVKGFAITLGLGVLFNLFTAVSVTRWVFQWLLEMNILKTKVPMLRLIGTPNIDWMGKRWYFWGVSLAISVVGIAALIWQGGNIWGIEFSSGTEASFRFKPGAMIAAGANKEYPNREIVEADLTKMAENLRTQARADLDKLNAQLASAPADQKDALLQKVVQAQARINGLTTFFETAKVETLLAGDKANDFLRKYDANGDGAIEKEEIVKNALPESLFAYLDAAKTGKVGREELAKRLPEWNYQVSTTLSNVDLLRTLVRDAFADELDTPAAERYEVQANGPVVGLNVTLDSKDEGLTLITPELSRKVRPDQQARFLDFTGGVMYVIRNVDPAMTESSLTERIQAMRLQPDFASFQFNRSAVFALTPAPTGQGFTSFAVLAWNPNADFSGKPAEWKAFAANELNLLKAALARSESLESVNSFDPAVAGETKQLAVMATIVSWFAIIVYLWFRFGKARWGLAAVICLVHDVLIAVGMIALSAVIAKSWLGPLLLVNSPIKIDMTVVAAFLTIIGYSVNDTIVVFDRIRENRGKLKTVDARMVNHAINQTLSRTLLTSLTVIMALVIMYVMGGAGIHPFCYAMLGGVVVGTYSSIAVAAPMLLVGTWKAARAKKLPSVEPTAGK